MGFLDKVFGSDEAKTTQKNTFEVYEPAQEALDKITDNLIPAYEQSQEAIDRGTPDDFAADLNEQQQLAIDNLIGSNFLDPAQQAATGLIDSGGALFNQGASGLGDFASGANQIGVDQGVFDQMYNEDLIQGQIDAIGSDISRNLQEGDLLNIDRQFAGIGGAGSSRAGIAEGVAIRGAQDQLADAASGIRTNAFNNANQAALNASSQNLSNQQNALNALLGAGGQQQQFGIGTSATLGQQGAENWLDAATLRQQQEQAEIQGQLQKQQLDATNPFLPLSQLQGLTLPLAQGLGSQQSTATTEQESGSLGKIASIGGAAASIFSDRRLKTRLRPNGEVFGMSFYHWDWTEEAKELVGNQPSYGWIAQEVQEHYPNAVKENINGYLQIDMNVLMKEVA